MDREIKQDQNRPGRPPRPAQWAPFMAAADVAHAYAIGLPKIQDNRSYQAIKMIESSRDTSYALLRNLGMDVEGPSRQADQVIRTHLQMLLAAGACAA